MTKADSRLPGQALAVAFKPFLLKEIRGHSQLSTTEPLLAPRADAAVIEIGSLGGRGRC